MHCGRDCTRSTFWAALQLPMRLLSREACCGPAEPEQACTACAPPPRTLRTPPLLTAWRCCCRLTSNSAHAREKGVSAALPNGANPQEGNPFGAWSWNRTGGVLAIFTGWCTNF